MAKVGFTTKGYIEVWWQSPAGLVFLSRHRQETEAIESLTTHAATQTGDQTYELRFPNKIVKAYGILASQGPAPATPTGLVLEDVTAGFVAVAWDNAGDATQWTVYRDGVSKGTTSNASFTDSTVVPSHADYSYQVQASNAAGASALSAALLVTTPANSLPSFALGGQALILNVGFSLNLSSYADDSDGHTLTFTKTSGSVPGLSLVGSTYSGTPTAVGAYPVVFDVFDGYDHVSSGTITFTVSDPDVTAPTVPGSVVASVNGSTVTVTWNASTDASGILRYRVFRGGTFRANADASPYVETGVPVGAYTYSVSAVDASANANESAQGSAPPVSVIPQNPDTPINFTAMAASSSQINLAWAAGPSGAAPDDYDVDFATAGASGPWISLSFTGTATTYQHTGRTASTQYWYRVRANKAGSTSSGYATASATTVATAGARKWNPGHYMYLQREGDHLTFAERKACYDHSSFVGNSKVVGAQFPFSWREMCPTTPGDFSAGIALVRQELNYLKSIGKRYVFRLFDSVYESTWGYYPRAFPDWLYNAGKLYIPDAPNNYSIQWKRWDSQALQWYLDIFRAVAAEFDSDPYFEQVLPFGESSYPAYLGGVNYTAQSEVALHTIADTLASIFTKTYITFPLNWSPDPYNNNLEKFCKYLADRGIGFGNVDSQPNNTNHAATGGMPADFPMRGELNTNGGTFCITGTKFPGPPCRVPIAYNIESTGAYRNTDPTWNYTGQQVYTWINSVVKATHMYWCRNTYAGRDDQRWFNAGTTNPGGILLAINNNPALSNTARPLV